MKLAAIILVLLLLPAALPAAQEDLSEQGGRVLDYLLRDWQEQMHSTNIALAMQNLGMPEDDDLRLEVGNHLRANLDIANNTKWWGANNYILSNQEKRIAKYLIFQHEKRDGRQPTLEEASAELGLPTKVLSARMRFMARAGVLEAAENRPLRFKLIEGYAKWGGPLRYNFHTITIGQGKPFDVW